MHEKWHVRPCEHLKPMKDKPQEETSPQVVQEDEQLISPEKWSLMKYSDRRDTWVHFLLKTRLQKEWPVKMRKNVYAKKNEGRRIFAALSEHDRLEYIKRWYASGVVRKGGHTEQGEFPTAGGTLMHCLADDPMGFAHFVVQYLKAVDYGRV